MNDRSGIAECLEAFAAIELERGRAAAAATLLGAAEATMESFAGSYARAERDRHEQTLAGVRARLGETELAVAWAEGRAQAPDAVLAQAVEAAEASVAASG